MTELIPFLSDVYRGLILSSSLLREMTLSHHEHEHEHEHQTKRQTTTNTPTPTPPVTIEPALLRTARRSILLLRRLAALLSRSTRGNNGVDDGHDWHDDGLPVAAGLFWEEGDGQRGGRCGYWEGGEVRFVGR